MTFNYFLATVMRNFIFLKDDYGFGLDVEEMINYRYVAKFTKKNFSIHVRYSVRNKYVEIFMYKNIHKHDPKFSYGTNWNSLLGLAVRKGILKPNEFEPYVAEETQIGPILKKFSELLKHFADMLQKANGW
ncbi:hypothetical protein JMG10_02645 [Nostoc ellipsosporum NOK]|nr:hypothetical protein [Nostoc ellipsosporum NOK]